MKTTLYHFWSAPESQRIRLALSFKGIAYEDRALDYDDDETFFELGIARSVPVLQLSDGRLLTDSLNILWQIDELFPDSPPLKNGRVDDAAWQAILKWRQDTDQVLARLYAPVRPGYRQLGDDPTVLQAYKSEVQNRFSMSVEELANDRYAGYEQLARLSRLPQLAKHLAQNRFYLGELSIADLLVCADLYPLQLLDGVAMPIDLLYYLQRVEESCNLDLKEGLLAS